MTSAAQHWDGYTWVDGESDRKGGWISTHTGRRFWPLDPRPDEIDIRDIAHALSNQCRFSGHSNRFYSVGEHSLRVSGIVPPEHALWALLHDASEAYLVDLPRPLKHTPGFAEVYREAEARLMLAVAERFGLDPVMPDEVERADQILLATERRDLLGADCHWEVPGVEPMAVNLMKHYGDNAYIKSQFLAVFGMLTKSFLAPATDGPVVNPDQKRTGRLVFCDAIEVAE